METVCDLRSGVSVLNFFESVDTRLEKSVCEKGQICMGDLHFA